jgi:hypothetical protein
LILASARRVNATEQQQHRERRMHRLPWPRLGIDHAALAERAQSGMNFTDGAELSVLSGH